MVSSSSLKAILAASLVVATHASAQVTLYAGEGFRGPAFPVNGTVWNFDRTGFNDRASSAIVARGRWEVCEDEKFQGRCAVLRPGNYPSLAAMGMNGRISSVRPVSSGARYEHEVPPPPPPVAVYEYRQRPSERLYQAPVTYARAVVGPPEQRCWVERQQVVQDSGANVPGAIVGAIVGGVLGHQVGGGRGKDVATAGGAVAGAALGANVGRGGSQVYGQDVQRCATVQGSAKPDYWDVGYDFKGVPHRAQLSYPPGPTITVNGNGEPRG